MSEEMNCKFCYGLVNKQADYCPHCRSPQNSKAKIKQYIPLIVIFSIIFIFSKFAIYSSKSDYKEPPSFLKYKNEISVKSSEFSFSECSDCNKSINVATIGIIENKTNFSWDDFDIEVRFYDKNGKMIDSISDSVYGLAVQPNNEVSFRVLDKAAKPISEYSTHKVYINNASETSVY